MKRVEVVILGGGIVGLATAHQLLHARPGLELALLEKEPRLAAHQSGHNSGVLHSGVYYRPGSLKARNCREGKRAMEAFCREEGIPYEICGKVIVAIEEGQLPALHDLAERGRSNGVDCRLVDRDGLAELEPHAAGLEALHVPEAGIVDYRAVCERLAARIREAGGSIVTGARARRLHPVGERFTVETEAGDFESDWVVNCTGLQSDRVFRAAGGVPAARIVPFRGEYYELVPAARHLCRGMIYPVADPELPFLGVHLTRTIDGRVECGPNAVLAFAREGYRKRDVSPRDLLGVLTYGGFWRLVARFWRTGASEFRRSFSKRVFTRSLQTLVPELRAEQLRRSSAGVRAQCVAPDGSMVDDFLIQEHGRFLHVGNAPSPAATSCLAIGRTLVERIEGRLS